MSTVIQKLNTPIPVVEWETPAYLVASALALAADLGLFSAGMHILGLHWFWAAALGFLGGAVVAYLLSVHWVFGTRRLAQAPDQEFMVFLLIGVVGIGITQCVLWLGIEFAGVLPEASKLIAAAATFVFNYTVRKAILFSPPVESMP